jgi:hypothetical protein
MDEGDSQILAPDDKFPIFPILLPETHVLTDGVDAAVDPNVSIGKVVVDFLI